jgi:hypothetical protein
VTQIETILDPDGVGDNIGRKSTMPIQGWNSALSQLAIFFESRLDGVLDL